MLNRIIAFSGFVIVAAIIATPAQDSVETAQRGGQSSGEGANGSASAASTDSSWYAGTHTLSRSADGHFYANIDVNGASMRMLVDTGASVVALTERDALDAGLTWNPEDVGPVGRGASGTVYGVATTIDRIELGGIAQRNVRAIIIPQGLDISLLGQSFLGGINSVEIANGQMALDDG